MAISPYVGSKLYQVVGPIETAMYTAYFDAGFAIFLFLFNCGPMVFSENKKFEEKLY